MGDVAGVVCVECGWSAEAAHVPDVCWSCGKRDGLHVLRVTTGPGLSIGVEFEPAHEDEEPQSPDEGA